MNLTVQENQSCDFNNSMKIGNKYFRFFRLKSRTNLRITKVHSVGESSLVVYLNKLIDFNLL